MTQEQQALAILEDADLIEIFEDSIWLKIDAHLWRDLWATETKTESITNG